MNIEFMFSSEVAYPYLYGLFLPNGALRCCYKCSSEHWYTKKDLDALLDYVQELT